jgi:hypothetical protein
LPGEIFEKLTLFRDYFSIFGKNNGKCSYFPEDAGVNKVSGILNTHNPFFTRERILILLAIHKLIPLKGRSYLPTFYNKTVICGQLNGRQVYIQINFYP